MEDGHPQGASSEQEDILDLQTSHPQRPPYQQPDISNLESDAEDASPKALWPLFVEIQPALSSLLRGLADWNAARTLQEELEHTDVDEASSTGDVESDSNERAKRFEYLNIYLPLYQAGLKGDWQATKAILEKYPAAVQAPITKGNQNILHIAAASKHDTYVKEVLKWMSPDDLKLKDGYGNTAFCFAAVSGIVKIAEEMVKIDSKLPLIRGSNHLLPLLMASLMENRDMVSYLYYSATPFEQLTASERIDLLNNIISTNLYDIALDILRRDTTLATAEDNKGRIALEVLAKKPFAIDTRSQMSTSERFLNSWYKGVRNKAFMQTLAHQLIEGLWKNIQILPDKQFSSFVDKHSSLLFVAAELGNVEFLTILLRSHPDLIYEVDQDNRSLFHISVLYRQESVFNLIYEIGALKDIIILFHDKNRDNMLHFAGQLAPSKRLNIVSGAALQMQRELLWFKEIEKIMPPAYLREKNLKGQTPEDIFIETHRKLQRDGETWMKDTSNYCMLVATLIATVVFAAAFTVPGGNQQENGTPIFLGSYWFMVFFISDAIAFLSSSSSILIFLSILTSRYKEEDFLKSLPGRLVFGLTTLFISIVGMVVAFSATCFLVYKSKTIRIPIVIIALAGVPIILFVLLHYDLWFDIIRSTYWSRFLFRPRKQGLF
ncbi:ankyrin repeat-containing protein NPR4-like [Corylus avellana]|uniref:ankyrin repeat-containing protein NPR4-like n=1 Tax=Corylus avellana TaxID=13451 RepID=UPI00286ACE0C|nr:ankyrin repeat-containing protein NPR4-like [Corylus avellana]